MSSRIPKPLGSVKKPRTCCTKHLNESKTSLALLESASNFSISKGDFSAIQGHRYGALHITGKTVVIQQGSVSRKKTLRPIRAAAVPWHQDSSDSAPSEFSSTTTDRDHRRTPVYSPQRRSVTRRKTNDVLDARWRQLLERESVARAWEEDLTFRDQSAQTREAQLGLEEQALREREEKLDIEKQTTRYREVELQLWEDKLRTRDEESTSREDDIRSREERVDVEKVRAVTRASELDEREKRLDLRELELNKREKEILDQGQDLEEREENVRKRQEELKEAERAVLALGFRFKEHMVVFQERCAELRGRKDRFSARKGEWAAAASAQAGKMERELANILSEFSL